MTHSNPQFDCSPQQSGQACYAHHLTGGLWLCTASPSYDCAYGAAWLDDFCNHPNRRDFSQPPLRDVRITSNIHDRRGFTLVEIMIVVAIIGLLAALAIPQFIKPRKQAQGRRILNDCRQLDGAIDQWAINNGIADGTTIDSVAATAYLKTPWNSIDAVGNPWGGSGVTGTGQIQVSTATKSSLDGVGIDWGNY